jgi:hypothetical protein
MQHVVLLLLLLAVFIEACNMPNMQPTSQQLSTAAYHTALSVVVPAVCSPQSFQGYQLWCNPRMQLVNNQITCYFGYFDGA